MEATVTQIPVYGDTLGEHNFEFKERSGLPKSYLKELDSIVSFEKIKSNSGVFVDVGGGTGELSSEIATQFGVKAVTIERSPNGLVVANNNGAIGESENMPVKNEVADIVHAKDLIEHLSDEKLAKFADEAKRILKVDGKLVVTEKDYYTGFPFYQKPEVSVEFNGKRWNEKILPKEDYQETYNRLKAKYGDGLTVGIPYFPRASKDIKQKFEDLGLKCESVTRWRAGKSEPDWFKSNLPRNIFVFSLK